MNALHWVSLFAFVAVISGLPMPQPQNLVPGVFIPADAFRNLQDRANANDRVNNPQPVSNQGYIPNTNSQNTPPITNQGYSPNTNVQNSQPITNQGYQPNANTVVSGQPTSNQGYQPIANVQNPPAVANQVYLPNTNVQNPQPNSNQGYQPVANIQTTQPNYQPVYANQPQYQPVVTFRTQPDANQAVASNQAQPLIVDQISGSTSNPVTVLPINQPSVVPANQPTVLSINQPAPQPSQGIIYVQQQQPNHQTIYVPQSNQGVQQPILYTQSPNQGFVVQNGQGGQPTKVVIANPSFGNQVQGQNPNTVFTLIPLNGQNVNSNTGSYLIPVQSGGSTPILLSTGS